MFVASLRRPSLALQLLGNRLGNPLVERYGASSLETCGVYRSPYFRRKPQTGMLHHGHDESLYLPLARQSGARVAPVQPLSHYARSIGLDRRVETTRRASRVCICPERSLAAAGMSGTKRLPDSTKLPPFEAQALRGKLTEFFEMKVQDPSGKMVKVGNYSFGVYAFFDYDGEPIYVGQTNERIRTRIGRHLTNQRTDAVAMSVLDPFEVFEVEVWPVPQFQGRKAKDPEARAHLDALERRVTADAAARSQFGAVLNEKNPPLGTLEVEPPLSHRTRIVSKEVGDMRSHPDVRIARRAQVIARLAQVISERKVTPGLRRVLLVQSQRLTWLAQRRFDALGVEALIEAEGEDENNGEVQEDGSNPDAEQNGDTEITNSPTLIGMLEAAHRKMEAVAAARWIELGVYERITLVRDAGLPDGLIMNEKPDPLLVASLADAARRDGSYDPEDFG